MGEPLADLRAMLGEISDLGRARALLAWDEWTMMPRAGAAARSEQIATLTRIRHDLLSSERLGRLLDEAGAAGNGTADGADVDGLVRVARREWEKAQRVSAELRADIARSTSVAEHAWADARMASDFQAFLPHLRRNVELARREAECLIGFDGCETPYEALLDGFEPGMRLPMLAPVLSALRDGLVPLVRELPAGDPATEPSCLRGSFPVDRQRELVRALAAELPLPEEGWRLDDTVHPFATGMGPGDVRITTRYDEGYLGTAVWSVIHEAGHALYNSGLPATLNRTPLYRSVSLGFDESQSRLWENWVGRGRPYVSRLHRHLVEVFPEQMDGVTAEDVHSAANRPLRSLIRVEADEVTYNLHIMLRFELERALIEDELDPADLPGAWAERVRGYLDLEVPDDRAGVLQDIHWAGGSFGYFPTYTVGNLIAAELFEAAEQEIAGLDSRIAAGDFAPLHDWLGDRLYRHGGRYTSPEMLERTVGALDADPLLRHLRRKLDDPR